LARGFLFCHVGGLVGVVFCLAATLDPEMSDHRLHGDDCKKSGLDPEMSDHRLRGDDNCFLACLSRVGGDDTTLKVFSRIKDKTI
jgi:hypothetical protein